MKKTLLITWAVVLSIVCFGQAGPKIKPGIKQTQIAVPGQHRFNDAMPLNNSIVAEASHQAKLLKSGDGTDFVNIIDIGNAANGFSYGYNNGSATIVWANNDLNMVINTHRMTDPPHSGNLAIDVSFDGGLTWEVNRQIYNVDYEEYRARYPQGGIYNPPGNTDPANAFLGFFSCSLDGSNGGDWGSYTYGSASIGDPTDTIVHYVTSNLAAGYARGIPMAFDLTQTGHTFMADACLEDSYVSYLGNIMIWKGTWNEETTDYEYEEQLVPVDCEYARYLRIAFSPDGQTGFVYWNDDNGSIPNMAERYYPILLRTTDGGETWDDNDVLSIQVSGVDGIEAIKNWLSDEMLIEVFGELPDRDDILYDVPWFNSDIAVDAWGNPHLACTVFLSGDEPGFIVTVPETFGVFDIFSMDGGETWQAQLLGSLKTIDNEYEPDFSEYHRVQIAQNRAGTKFFFTWNDTDIEGFEDNSNPDIYARGFDCVSHMLTANADGEDAPDNVTTFTEGMWTAFFHATSKYILENDGVYTIPMTYEHNGDPFQPSDPVQYKYITDFSYTDDNFTIVGIEDDPKTIQSTFTVEQNVPNPCHNTTTIKFNLLAGSKVDIQLSNILGQAVIHMPEKYYPAGIQQMSLDLQGINPGIYFYTVSIGKESTTTKLIIK